MNQSNSKTRLQRFSDKAEKALAFLEVPHPDGAVHDISVLKNPDLEPIPPSRRYWGVLSNFGYWGIPSIGPITWMTGGSFIGGGLSVGEIMGALVLGDFVTLLFTLANSYPGSTWHVGFTMCQRIVFGIYGSSIGILLRIILSIVNYGSYAWLGGLAMTNILSSWSESFFNMENTFPEGAHMTKRDFVGFLIFQVITMFSYLMKPERMNVVVLISCGMCFFSFIGMTIWAVKMGGYGDQFKVSTTLSGSEKAWEWVFIISYWFGSVSPSSTNQSDYSRFASSSMKVVIGTSLALMIPTIVVPVMGIVAASAGLAKYDNPFWLPSDMYEFWLSDGYTAKARAATFFCSLSMLLSSLSASALNCGFAGGMDLAGIFPKYINIQRGAVITALLSWACLPWQFYNSSPVFLSVMSSFGVVMTPMVTILICDFFVVRKRRYKLSDAFTLNKKGNYYYFHGVNLRAVAAWIFGMTLGLPGLANSVDPTLANNQGIINFYMGDTFFAFIMSFFSYWLLCVIFPVPNAQEVDKRDYYNAFTLEECQKWNMEPFDGSIPEYDTQSETSKYYYTEEELPSKEQ